LPDGKKRRVATQYSHLKYHDPDYSDDEVEGLMRYFRVDAYKELALLLEIIGIRKG
jgi:hypothetical protein